MCSKTTQRYIADSRWMTDIAVRTSKDLHFSRWRFSTVLSESSTQVQKLKKQRKITENTTFLKSHKMSLYRQLMVARSIRVTSSTSQTLGGNGLRICGARFILLFLGFYLVHNIKSLSIRRGFVFSAYKTVQTIRHIPMCAHFERRSMFKARC